jgi:hypothetical protein
MKFKPFNNAYEFKENRLIETFPDYLLKPLASWFFEVLHYQNALDRDSMYTDQYYLKTAFRNEMQILFHESFPQKWQDFLGFIFANKNRTANFLALCLQNYTRRSQANGLEYILREGGSAYQVSATDKNASEYDTGMYDLTMRVPSEVVAASESALKNSLLHEAWQLAYARKPDDEKVVSKCADFLEGYFKQKYFPNDPKPQLKKFVHAFQTMPETLSYQGDTLITPKSRLTDLLVDVSNIRGQHTQGQGRLPTHDEAIFVLHTTILIWNLDNGVK